MGIAAPAANSRRASSRQNQSASPSSPPADIPAQPFMHLLPMSARALLPPRYHEDQKGLIAFWLQERSLRRSGTAAEQLQAARGRPLARQLA